MVSYKTSVVTTFLKINLPGADCARVVHYVTEVAKIDMFQYIMTATLCCIQIKLGKSGRITYNTIEAKEGVLLTDHSHLLQRRNRIQVNTSELVK